ncbi:NB-ARC protein [Chondrus crispus]|uniref:NB-ARC protein n=1 Tax=Chondrus crispus TaxID=2769 RepID=R7QRI4_CHOCR|nr:NB-ARC protein [Chondrus crispus]CDF40096.1 NB-ARC protein [Chondrus crispus]|eukprot:XP_005710390.1 NB-ARC protein [Chondrus crispus]
MKEIEDRGEIKESGVVGRREPKYGYGSLYGALRTALQILDSDAHAGRVSFQKMYAALCATEKQDVISLKVLVDLWEAADDKVAEEYAKEMDRVGLVSIECKTTLTRPSQILGIRLHDLAHDFVRQEAERMKISFWDHRWQQKPWPSRSEAVPLLLRKRDPVHRLVHSAIPKSYNTLTHTFSVISQRHRDAQIFSTDFRADGLKDFTTTMINTMNDHGSEVAEYLRNAILFVLENNFPYDRVLVSNTLNNISVMYFTEPSPSFSGPQLRKQGRELLQRAIDISKQCDKARANLALLLWRGHDIRNDGAEISRAIKLLEEAISICPLPRYKFLLARVLMSAESGVFCDWVRAKALLTEAVRDDLYKPAVKLLADMPTHGHEEVPLDVSGATRLRSRAQQHSKDITDMLQRVDFQDSREYVEKKLKEAKAKQSQIFLMVLGGGARGKTSLVRSLRGLPFVSEYNQTELAALSRIQVLLGSRNMSEEDGDELAFSQDSLNAILSRQATSSPVTVIRNPSVKAQTATVEKTNQDPALSILHAYSKSGHATINDQRTPQRTTSSINLAPQIGNTFQPPKTTIDPHLARVRNYLENSSTLKKIDGTLVQCWDLAGQSQYVMAHALFVKNGSLFVFVVNLKNLWNISTRVEEVRELCRWMQLVHALVPDSESVRPIIVGTYKDSCGDLGEAEKVLREGLLDEVGEAVYDTWVRDKPEAENGEGRAIPFIAVENRTAKEDPGESGIEELEKLIKRLSDDIVASRLEIPLRWIAFVEEVERKSAEMNAERMSTVVWNTQEIFKCADGFPAFSTKKEERHEEALRALKYFSKLGRCVLFDMPKEGVYLFPRPAAMLDFVRRVTGPEEKVRRSLPKKHALSLRDGLLTKEGLKKLWDEHSQEICDMMLDALCSVDILMRVQFADGTSGTSEDLIAIPALLKEADDWQDCTSRPNESEVRLVTEFVDAFPHGLMGCLISHLHKKVGRVRPKVGFVGANAADWEAKIELKESGRVVFLFVSQQRRIEWKVYAQDPLSVARSCVTEVEELSRMSLSGKKFPMKHFLRTKCRSNKNKCGGEWTAKFEMPGDWVENATKARLPYLEGECPAPCGESWRLLDLMPDIEKYYGRADPKALKALAVIPRSSKEVGMKAVDVFISHAGVQKGKGGDKLYFARPLYNDLCSRGMCCFLDKFSLRPGDDARPKMTSAMETADIGVFILSPEFACRRWTMKELECFQARKRKASETEKPKESVPVLPILIPVFYRLSLQECRRFDPEKYSKLFRDEGFYDEARQRKMSTATVTALLKELSWTTGIENDVGASNDIGDPFAPLARKSLVEIVAMAIQDNYDKIQANRIELQLNSSTWKPT